MNTFQPKDRETLIKIIFEQVEIYGNQANLNFIDTSLITDMSYLFLNKDFNGDISQWNVSNVENMEYMFYESKFNSDISRWDVRNVKNMSNMFSRTIFNGDISSWNVSSVENMQCMFLENRSFNSDISRWDVRNVKKMDFMLFTTRFTGDIHLWDPKNDECSNFISTHYTQNQTFKEYKQFCERRYLQTQFLSTNQTHRIPPAL